MALEMRVYEELTQVNPKVLAGLTFRQLLAVILMAAVVAGVAVPMWLWGDRELISWMVIPAVAPIAAWGWWKPMGLRLEVWLRHFLRFRLGPRKAVYANHQVWGSAPVADAPAGRRGRKEHQRVQRLEAGESGQEPAKKRRGKQRRKRGSGPRPQSMLWYEALLESGVCVLGNGRYSASLRLSDINYQLATEDRQKELLERYARFFNMFNQGQHLQITIVNRRMERDALLARVLFPEPRHGDAFSGLRADHNKLVRDAVGDARYTIVAEKYLTLTVEAGSLDEAVGMLDPLCEQVITQMWTLLECGAERVRGVERIRLLRELTRGCYLPGFDWRGLAASAATTRDELAPQSVERPSHAQLVLGGDEGPIWCETLAMRDYPSWMSDQLFRRLSEVQTDLVISFHISPIDRAESREMVTKRKAMLDMERSERRRKLLKGGMDPELDLPHDLRRAVREVEELLNDLDDNDQRLLTTTLVVMVRAESKEQLEERVERVRQAAKSESCALTQLRYLQEAGFNTALPLGRSWVPMQRTLTSAATAVMVPFTSQEILDDGGLFYGRNVATGNPIIADRRRTRNGNAFVLGTSGSGKSHFSKWEMAEVLIGRPKDELIIIDPEREYRPLADAFQASVVEVHAGSTQVINPFDIVTEDPDGDPVRNKVESLLSMMRVLLGGTRGMDPAHESIMDRSITNLYRRHLERPGSPVPTLLELYDELRRQPEDGAKVLATQLELYATGSFSGFAQQTNVDVSNRFVLYDISKLGDHMRLFGMMVVLDQVWNRVLRNFGKGIRTWLYVDEFHLMLASPHAMARFLSMFKRARKYGLLPTGITQNVEEVLAVPEARLMLSNCDVLFLLGQKKNDADELAALLDLSEEQIRAFTNVEAGCGLLTVGATTLGFNARKQQDPQGPLLQLLSTSFKD